MANLLEQDFWLGKISGFARHPGIAAIDSHNRLLGALIRMVFGTGTVNLTVLVVMTLELRQVEPRLVSSDATIMAIAWDVSRRMLERYSHVRMEANRDGSPCREY